MASSSLPSQGFQSAPRVHQAITATVERRILQRLARSMPRSVGSDHLTALAFAAQLGAGVSYAFARNHPLLLLVASGFLILNWFGDSLDGTVARVRNQQRPRYGFYVDHIVDIFGATALMSGLALSGFVHPVLGMAMLVAFLLLAAESYLATYTLARFQLSAGLFGPTEVRLLLIAGNAALLRSPYAHVFGHKLLLFDLGGGIATCSMLIASAAIALRHTRELYRQEPLP